MALVGVGNFFKYCVCSFVNIDVYEELSSCNVTGVLSAVCSLHPPGHVPR